MSENRNQHLFVTLAIVGLILASCLLEQVDARRHRSGSSKRSHHRPKNVNIEIYHPKGVMIWYPYRPGIEMFGIEIFINQDNTQADSSEEVASRISCDICLNTTKVTYGKFILQSEDAIIRSRDHVFYNVIVKKTNGEARVSRSNEFYVSESRILMGEISKVDKPSESAVTSIPPVTDTKPNPEIKLLEDILLEVYDQCYADQNQTKQLLLSAETQTRLDAKQLYQFTFDTLSEMLPEIAWNGTLVDAFYVTDDIGFAVATIIDKLKVLKLAKALPERPITDLDFYQNEDTSNDIEAWA
ncbi:uncharacterized protein LOC128725618 [Anopheles nili]|uniref:uncharacterized protein LOC128725618 n=1 Tax=Anopheles nili TaxID=185578 RepID=UPI00237A26F8|nr:uncharacterized protein LOC128725618 [Anopheles nili]